MNSDSNIKSKEAGIVESVELGIDDAVNKPVLIDYEKLSQGGELEVWVQVEDGTVYRLQKTKFGKLLLSK